MIEMCFRCSSIRMIQVLPYLLPYFLRYYPIFTKKSLKMAIFRWEKIAISIFKPIKFHLGKSKYHYLCSKCSLYHRTLRKSKKVVSGGLSVSPDYNLFFVVKWENFKHFLKKLTVFGTLFYINTKIDSGELNELLIWKLEVSRMPKMPNILLIE